MTTEVRVIPLEGIPEIEEDDDLAALLLAAAEASGSSGSRTSVPAPFAFEASTPADAHT